MRRAGIDKADNGVPLPLTHMVGTVPISWNGSGRLARPVPTLASSPWPFALPGGDFIEYELLTVPRRGGAMVL